MTTNDNETKARQFAQELRQWRRERGYTQAQAAGIALVPLSTWQHWESGRVLPRAVVRAGVRMVMKATVTVTEDGQ